MTQPRLAVPTLFFAPVLAAIAAGCSGGGAGSLPTTPDAPSDATSRGQQPVGAVLRIHIPRKRKHHGRGAEYVSPNTLALTVGAQHVTASPWPSMPLQTFVVNTPAPCTPVAGGLNCTFAVKAYLGKNVFTFNEYATKNPQPQDVPLGTLTTGATKVTSGSAALNFVLNGVVNQIELSVPNAESTISPATENTEAIPIGAPASFALGIDPEDASGASIATDRFSSPITIQVLPANSGVSLALNKKCAGDKATPTTITLNCAKDLTSVTIAYDGTVTQTGANAYVDAATVAASPQLASPSPQPARVALASNVLSYQLVAAGGTPAPIVNTSNVALDPVSGKMVFAYTSGGTNPTFVEFNPASPAAPPATASVGFNIGFLIFDASGHLWTNNETSSTLQCFTSISAASATFAISDAFGTISNPVIATDNSGNVWYSGLDQSGYPSIGFFPRSCAAGSPQQAQFVINSADETPVGLALAQPPGGHAAVGMVTNGYSYSYYTASTATAATPTPATSWPINEYPGGLVNDNSYNIFAASRGTAAVNKIAAGTTTVQTLLSLAPGSAPNGLDQYSGTQPAAQALALSDINYDAGVFVSPVAASTEPLVIPITGNCGPVGFDKNGGAWTFCHRGDGSIWANRMVVTSTWNPFLTSFDGCGPASVVLGVPESSSSTSHAPFSVVANSNPSVIAVATPFPGNYPHEIPLTVNGTGTATLTIADKYGRTESVTVSDVSVSCSGRLPRRAHHGTARSRP